MTFAAPVDSRIMAFEGCAGLRLIGPIQQTAKAKAGCRPSEPASQGNFWHQVSFLLRTERVSAMQVDHHAALAAREELLAAIADESFPCLGAKSAMARGKLRTLVCESLDRPGEDARVHSALMAWVEDYRSDPVGLRSLAVVFVGPTSLDERQFETAMWKRLQSLANIDERRNQRCDSSVSLDPDDPHFSLSFGGAAFFVVGLHPNASRPARRMPRPTLVFNLHDQFERLREEGKYERMRERILNRDKALAGSINPMLARFGEESEARQYSGRAVGKNWRCPFRDPRTAHANR